MRGQHLLGTANLGISPAEDMWEGRGELRITEKLQSKPAGKRGHHKWCIEQQKCGGDI